MTWTSRVIKKLHRPSLFRSIFLPSYSRASQDRASNSPSYPLPFSRGHHPDVKMSTSSSSCSYDNAQQPSSFAQIAGHYRIFMLEDLLAEPQEMAYDPYREVIYVSQRCLQGRAASPVEYSTYVSVFDASPNSRYPGFLHLDHRH